MLKTIVLDSIFERSSPGVDRERADAVERTGNAPAGRTGEKHDQPVLEYAEPLEAGREIIQRDGFVTHAERFHDRRPRQVVRQDRLDRLREQFAEHRAVGHRQRGQADAECALRVVQLFAAPGFPEQIELFDDGRGDRIAGRGEPVIGFYC